MTLIFYSIMFLLDAILGACSIVIGTIWRWLVYGNIFYREDEPYYDIPGIRHPGAYFPIF